MIPSTKLKERKRDGGEAQGKKQWKKDLNHDSEFRAIGFESPTHTHTHTPCFKTFGGEHFLIISLFIFHKIRRQVQGREIFSKQISNWTLKLSASCQFCGGFQSPSCVFRGCPALSQEDSTCGVANTRKASESERSEAKVLLMNMLI